MAEPGPDGIEGRPESSPQFITQKDIDPRQLEFLLAQARSKFPEKLDAIVRKYGAFEYEMSDDGLEVLDILPPTDYIEHNDHQEMERWASGDVGIDRATFPLSSDALLRIAEGQLASVQTGWDQMRNDPEYLVNLITDYASFCVEATIPDQRSGETYSPEQLLRSANFVSHRFRYSVHNHLLIVGTWSLIVTYLRDVQKLDNEVGRFGDRTRRGFIMSQVKQLLDQHQDTLFKIFRTSVLADVPSIRKNVKRETNHAGFAGAQIIHEGIPEEAKILLPQESLHGALYRMQLMAELRRNKFHVMHDITTNLNSATEEEKAIFTPRMMDAWLDLAKLSDLIVMLGEDGEDWERTPHDPRYLAHARGAQLSQKIFEDATIEKHVKSIESLRSEAKVKKIWEEIDKISKKRNKTTIEKVVAFTDMKPSWTHRPLALPSTAASPTSSTPLQLPPVPEGASTGDEQEDESRAEGSSGQSSTLPPVDDNYVPPRPYTDQQHIRSNDSELPTMTSTIKKSKVKTRGTTQPTSQTTAAVRAQIDDTSSKPLYHVKKKVYETLEQLLVRTERTMVWDELEYALIALGFSKVPNCGSERKFGAPSGRDRPFCIHQPHRPGNSSEEMPRRKVMRLGKQLKTLYGWDISFFEIQRDRD